MKKLKCKKAGKVVVSKTNIVALCKSCSGEILINNRDVTLSTNSSGFLPLPAKPEFDFNCPATMQNPGESDLVE